MSIEECAHLRVEAARRFFDELKTLEVAVAIGSTLVQQGTTFPDEWQYIARAVQHRQQEFALGRSLARTALLELGCPRVAIPAGTDRAPIWPDGIVGSISHCDDLCVAALAGRNSRIRMLGVDVEKKAPNSDLIDVVTTVRERQSPWFLAAKQTEALASICFSAKESAYKSIYPTMRQYLDFQDVDIEVDFSTASFTAKLAPHAQNNEIGEIRGRISVAGNLVMTYAVA